MSDEPKVPPEAAGASETPAKPGAQAEGEPAKPAAPSKPAFPAAPAGGAAPPSAAAPPKPAPPAAKPAPKPVVKPEPWSSPLVDELAKRFPGAISEALIFRNQPWLVVTKESLVAISEYLKSDEGGAYIYLTDETAVDYPKREKRFEVVYTLFSFKLNHRLRLKVLAAEGEKVPSVVRVWPTANWLEREVFDMFGVEYEGHPDLRRILLPEEWVGHPLRKDYDILKQDDAWVEANLHIKSGQ
ncbi:MAG TPA: NADH-quinone oxidoreductase subunit C [Terriglobia bacterium]|nr:NADH-quinone oxidoreductase subunit C [Terriglobia bacterium]